MKIFYIHQDEVNGYDTYDSAVVIAETPDEAAKIHPRGTDNWDEHERDGYSWGRDWASHPSKVTAEYIGDLSPIVTRENRVICASFNAG